MKGSAVYPGNLRGRVSWRNKMKKRIVIVVAIVLAVLFMASAYGQITQCFAYVADSGSNNVSAYAINPNTGALTPVGAAISSGRNPYGIEADPTGKFVYVANNGSANVSAYAINSSTGALTAISGSPFPGSSPYAIAVAPKG